MAARVHERPAVTVDVAVVAPRRGHWQVLLVQRGHAPFLGQWALPGGFVEPYEPLEAAARRELLEETGIEAAHLAQVHTFGEPGRDPRGWTISVAHLARVSEEEAAEWQPRAGSDADDVRWFDLDALPTLAFDHAEILEHVRRKLGIGD
ncbi:MAG: NUDIX hydrolase [Anaerolineae bacterium]|nr:NUDIX hydrolase [Anaerolineae bacterium]